MRLFEIHELYLSYPDKSLFRSASLMVRTGEHIGLVGPNGCGKTTFLRVLLGEVVPDRWIFETNGRLQIGYLDQHADVRGAQTAQEYLKSVYRELYELERQLGALYEQVPRLCGKEQTKALNRAQQILDRLCEEEFDRADKKIEGVLKGLGFSDEDLESPVESLSGGMKTRLLLAKILLQKSDLLILDEPTNFLDIGYSQWLADYLSRYEGTCIVISHDAAFLEKVCGRIVEIANRSFRDYRCTYSEYLSLKQGKDETQLLQYRAQQTMIAKAESYIRANSEEALGGIVRTKATWLKKMLYNLERIEKPDTVLKPRFRFIYKPGAAAEVLTLRSAVVGYGDRAVLPPLSLRVQNGEKIVFMGYNGIGKTTLLRTLCGDIPLLSGRLELGERVEYTFFRQEEGYSDGLISNGGINLGPAAKKEKTTVMEFARWHFPHKTQRELAEALAACGLTGTHFFGRVSSLSGGEMTRLRLGLAMLKPKNLIMLDEPTNHLDVYSKEVLMHAVASFEGAVLMTTHDTNIDFSFARVINLEELFV